MTWTARDLGRKLPMSYVSFPLWIQSTMYYSCRSFRLALLIQTFWPLVHAVDKSFLSQSLVRQNQIQNVLGHQPVKLPECENTPPTGPIDTTLCDFETVESVNDDLLANLKALVKTPFFKYFRVDLYRECPFWDDAGACMDPSCAITSVDESDIPEKWRAKELSRIDGPVIDDALHRLPGCYYRDSDFCFLDDHTEGEYFDLSQIPERYTGYSGPDARRIWSSIYQENCFGLSEISLRSGKSPAPVNLPDTMSDALREDGDGTCLEKRVYYKVISGLHASISTHICLEWLNQTTGEWGPNLQCFVNRIASHPERLKYIYFNTVLLLRAAARLEHYLNEYDYCSTGSIEDDAETKAILRNVLSIARHAGQFDETVLFRGENANVLKEEFKTHFRNVTRIMDCIGCDKCRLWGKVQTTGVATALKILFEMDEVALDPHSNSNLLQRTEVVALFNTLHRFSESLSAVNDFRAMWSEVSESEEKELIQEAEKATATKPRPSPLAGQDQSDSLVEVARIRLSTLVRVCKESTVGCFQLILNAWTKGVQVLSSVLKPSGKENGPSFGEL